MLAEASESSGSETASCDDASSEGAATCAGRAAAASPNLLEDAAETMGLINTEGMFDLDVTAAAGSAAAAFVPSSQPSQDAGSDALGIQLRQPQEPAFRAASPTRLTKATVLALDRAGATGRSGLPTVALLPHSVAPETQSETQGIPTLAPALSTVPEAAANPKRRRMTAAHHPAATALSSQLHSEGSAVLETQPDEAQVVPALVPEVPAEPDIAASPKRQRVSAQPAAALSEFSQLQSHDNGDDDVSGGGMPLPPGWSRAPNPHGDHPAYYYYNASGGTQWTLPRHPRPAHPDSRARPDPDGTGSALAASLSESCSSEICGTTSTDRALPAGMTAAAAVVDTRDKAFAPSVSISAASAMPKAGTVHSNTLSSQTGASTAVPSLQPAAASASVFRRPSAARGASARHAASPADTRPFFVQSANDPAQLQQFKFLYEVAAVIGKSKVRGLVLYSLPEPRARRYGAGMAVVGPCIKIRICSLCRSAAGSLGGLCRGGASVAWRHHGRGARYMPCAAGRRTLAGYRHWLPEDYCGFCFDLWLDTDTGCLRTTTDSVPISGWIPTLTD